jgi:hypothetical protein
MRYLLLLAGLALTLGGGYAYGKLSQRWGPPPNLQQAAERVAEFPEQIGDWQLASELPMGDSVVEMLQCAGHVNRRYVNRQTGQSIGIALIVGPPGPTAVHTPEICYNSRAYRQDQERLPERLSGPEGTQHVFWRTRFSSRDVGGQPMGVWFAWSDGTTWEASRSPRFEFGGKPLLYKIQLAGNLPRGKTEAVDDPCRDFLQQLLNSEWRPIAG